MKKIVRCFLVLPIIFVFGCTVVKQSTLDISISSDQFAFVEFIQSTSGKVLKGTPPQGKRIDRPIYRFNVDDRSIRVNGSLDFSIDSLKVLLGSVKVLKGTAGNGASSALIGVNYLPYRYSNFEIVGIDPTNLSVMVDNVKHDIRVGQEWQKSVTVTDTLNFNGAVIVENTIVTRIKFHGLLSKASLKKE
ncbi:MAG: hypothetical protein AB7S48_02920 [Bacteroidales bacterium]